jgi:inner membrane protein
MVIVDFFVSNGPWAWFVLGLVLLALELVVPGGWFLWLGAAGLITGLLTFIPGLTAPWEAAIFGALSLITVIGWRLFTRGRVPKSDSPLLNQRAARFIGHEVTINEPISQGFGRVSLGDTVWRVSGPDLPAGEKVRIIGAEGAVLKVEAV